MKVRCASNGSLLDLPCQHVNEVFCCVHLPVSSHSPLVIAIVSPRFRRSSSLQCGVITQVSHKKVNSSPWHLRQPCKQWQERLSEFCTMLASIFLHHPFFSVRPHHPEETIPMHSSLQRSLSLLSRDVTVGSDWNLWVNRWKGICASILTWELNKDYNTTRQQRYDVTTPVLHTLFFTKC